MWQIMPRGKRREFGACSLAANKWVALYNWFEYLIVAFFVAGPKSRNEY